MYYTSKSQKGLPNVAANEADSALPTTEHQDVSDQLTIHLISTSTNANSMPDSAKARARENAPTLIELFNQNVATDDYVRHWVGADEFAINGLPKHELDAYLTIAKELGKSIKLTNTITVKISD